MSLPRREAAQRLPRREDVYAFVFIIFSRDSRDHSPFYARRRRPFSARGHRPFYARPDKRGSVPLRASSDSSASSFSRVSSFSRDSR